MLSPEYRALECMLRGRPLFQIDPNLDPLKQGENVRASFPLDTIVPLYIYSGLECDLSRLFDITVIHLEYRLVPEHSLPSAVDDTLALYRVLLHDDSSTYV
ncbi:unnamed protein product [Rotaria magnacalcarata]|uniref:Alpha/beta hydrolase fold-3 domain-containing protein n=1 Tax=Rotaria magnacalcarata TaxID=392030 RepID=A0A816GUC1_9BILA|nr:unnamed protein product [Rotaria magnacalcarata]CAF1677563.1 unnamed protein product [Rotaria magnacalcarata]CAF3772540.1 unnamed protein product [Rotaria magnacalcarata]CAF4089282.1 unnamed protein product [Rotaria magnacalcarata]CAF4592373.1 unnamed protein product [Rotaria magnacalcarata]